RLRGRARQLLPRNVARSLPDPRGGPGPAGAGQTHVRLGVSAGAPAGRAGEHPPAGPVGPRRHPGRQRPAPARCPHVNARHPDTERLYWPADQIRPYQLARLRETVARAARSPYYGPRLAGLRVESLDDLPRLPVTPKEDARAASPFGLLAVEP